MFDEPCHRCGKLLRLPFQHDPATSEVCFCRHCGEAFCEDHVHDHLCKCYDCGCPVAIPVGIQDVATTKLDAAGRQVHVQAPQCNACKKGVGQ